MKSFSARRSWATANDCAGGRTGRFRDRPARGRHVLELVGDHVDARANARAPRRRIEPTDVASATSKAGASVRRKTRVLSRAARRPGPACGRAGRRRGCRSCCREAAAVSGIILDRLRQRCRFARRAGHDARRQRLDRRAPGSAPRAGRHWWRRRADGKRPDRHAGRHLRDRQETVEALERAASTGTPSTGSSVMEAVMPGR